MSRKSALLQVAISAVIGVLLVIVMNQAMRRTSSDPRETMAVGTGVLAFLIFATRRGNQTMSTVVEALLRKASFARKMAKNDTSVDWNYVALLFETAADDIRLGLHEKDIDPIAEPPHKGIDYANQSAEQLRESERHWLSLNDDKRVLEIRMWITHRENKDGDK